MVCQLTKCHIPYVQELGYGVLYKYRTKPNQMTTQINFATATKAEIEAAGFTFKKVRGGAKLPQQQKEPLRSQKDWL